MSKSKSLQQQEEELNNNYNKGKAEILLEFGKLCFKHKITVFAKASSFYNDEGGTSEYCDFYFYKNDNENFPSDSEDLENLYDDGQDDSSFVEKKGFLISLDADDFDIQIPYESQDFWKIEFSKDGKPTISEL